MLAVENNIRVFFDLLANRRFAEARVLLSSVDFDAKIGKRRKKHYEAQILMFEGRHSEAAVELYETIQTHGSNVGLHVDLATCHHQTGNFRLLATDVASIEQILAEHADAIEFNRQIRYSLFLAKFYEELGEFAKAFATFKNLRTYESKISSADEWINFEIQELRLLSLFSSGAEVAQCYANVVHKKEEEIPALVKLDWLHAMMLSETFLIGPEHGLVRWKALELEKSAGPKEKWFYLAEFAIALLLKGHSMPFDQSPLTKPNAEMVFESLVIELLFQDKSAPLQSNLNPPAGLSPGCNLLWLLVLIHKHPEHKFELLLRFKLFLNNLSKASQKYWTNLLPTLVINTQPVSFAFNGEAILLNGTAIKTGPKATVSKLLKLLSEKASCSIEEICRQLWGDWNVSYHDRLRMIVQRLNHEVKDICFVDAVVKVSKTHVVKNVSFSFVDEGKH